MRDIKFRAWDTNPLQYDKKMLYMDDMTVENIKNQGSYVEKVLNILTYINNNRYKIMQYTGIKDKHGHKIFEGDILSTGECVWDNSGKSDILQVMFIEGFETDGFRGRLLNSYELSGFIKPTYTTIKSRYEIIGNIYENGDLLCQ